MTSSIRRFAETATLTTLLSQSEYLADAQRLTGNIPGTARSKLVNRALRQSTFVAAALAELASEVTGSDISDDLDFNDMIDQFRLLIVQGSRQVGEILTMQGAAIPTLCLPLKNDVVNRADYPALYAYAVANSLVAASGAAKTANPTLYGPGNGSTTFQLPDYRGLVLKALDQSRGLDSGRVVGTQQLAALPAALTGTVWAENRNNGAPSGVFENTGNGLNPSWSGGGGEANANKEVRFDPSNVFNTGPNLVVDNVAVYFFVRAK
jgi:hypothetical protein